ncbi:hypothetical protein [Myceligenerans pegani]|uniref:Uncharacterized protein n=1 Tax=Myceligenerans pegani TaxID=2776917 RepID=A0ABR9MSI9_9MICO|nr:hypothetical protein [Myceligenerans sp. TRM 65318]MBE1874355.1 hypothetical protein [Myceligenerans sp. TRM 65318]MBE3016626.1 hypothetical protein [Myceligenerans sp. TRM 65318]
MGETTFLYLAIATAVLAIPAAVLVTIAAVASGFSGLLRLGFGALRAGVIPEHRYVRDHDIDQLSAVRGIVGVVLLTTAELMRSRALPTKLPAPIPDTGLPSWIGILAHGTLWAVSSLAAVALLISLGSLLMYKRQIRYPPPMTPEDGRARSVLSPFLPLRAPATLALISILTVAYVMVLPPLWPEGGAELPEAQPPEVGSLLLLAVLMILGIIGLILLVGVVAVGLPLAVTFHSRGADGHPALPALWSLALAGLYTVQRGPEWFTVASDAVAGGASGTLPGGATGEYLVTAAMPGFTGTLIIVAISVWELARLHVVHGIDPWTPTAVLTPARGAETDNPLVADPQAVPDLRSDNPRKSGAARIPRYLRRKLWQVGQTVKG